MLSFEMQRLIEALSEDWDFIERFIDQPEAALEGFNLSQAERQALETRSVEGLASLGLDEHQLNIAMSGAHTPTCPLKCMGDESRKTA